MRHRVTCFFFLASTLAFTGSYISCMTKSPTPLSLTPLFYCLRRVLHSINCVFLSSVSSSTIICVLNATVTLNIRSRSPKSNQLLTLSQQYRHANLVTFQPMVYNMQTSTDWLKFSNINPTVTLKIRSRSPKPNQRFILPQCYVREKNKISL